MNNSPSQTITTYLTKENATVKLLWLCNNYALWQCLHEWKRTPFNSNFQLTLCPLTVKKKTLNYESPTNIVEIFTHLSSQLGCYTVLSPTMGILYGPAAPWWDICHLMKKKTSIAHLMPGRRGWTGLELTEPLIVLVNVNSNHNNHQCNFFLWGGGYKGHATTPCQPGIFICLFINI